MKLTKSLKPAEVERKWLVFDAEGMPAGRLATAVAAKLSGRESPKYTPHVDSGDFVIVLNAEKVHFTGDKEIQKKYYRHTGFPGGIKETSLGKMRAEKPEKVITAAVYGMLPKNKLRDGMMKRLKVYAGDEHPHKAQNPKTIEMESK